MGQTENLGSVSTFESNNLSVLFLLTLGKVETQTLGVIN